MAAITINTKSNKRVRFFKCLFTRRMGFRARMILLRLITIQDSATASAPHCLMECWGSLSSSLEIYLGEMRKKRHGIPRSEGGPKRCHYVDASDSVTGGRVR